MTAIKESLWASFKNEAERLVENNKDLEFYADKKSEFDKEFDALYGLIMEQCMAKDVDNLDAHKQASIGAIVFSKIAPIGSKVAISDDEVFIVNESLGLSVALSCMQDYLNTRLQRNGKNTLDKPYDMPEPINCNDNFFFIMCRTMYYNKLNGIIDKTVLNLADILFLIEYITLQNNNISLDDLKIN